MTETAKSFVSLAERLADAASAVARRHFRTPVAVDAKADSSPVTVADRGAEAAMRTILGQAVPEHGIYGEEHGLERSDAEFVWVLDPIDGTKSFVTGRPLFGTLIALMRAGRPVLGIIDCPALGERWIGVEGERTRFNGETVRTRSCQDLATAWMATTSPDMYTGNDARSFARLATSVRHTIYGGDCHSYAMLASGFLDLVLDADTQPYDYCALVPVIEGAGGVITDWDGAALNLNSDGRILAAGDRALHAVALRVLSA